MTPSAKALLKAALNHQRDNSRAIDPYGTLTTLCTRENAASIFAVLENLYVRYDDPTKAKSLELRLEDVWRKLVSLCLSSTFKWFEGSDDDDLYLVATSDELTNIWPTAVVTVPRQVFAGDNIQRLPNKLRTPSDDLELRQDMLCYMMVSHFNYWHTVKTEMQRFRDGRSTKHGDQSLSSLGAFPRAYIWQLPGSEGQTPPAVLPHPWDVEGHPWTGAVVPLPIIQNGLIPNLDEADCRKFYEALSTMQSLLPPLSIHNFTLDTHCMDLWLIADSSALQVGASGLPLSCRAMDQGNLQSFEGQDESSTGANASEYSNKFEKDVTQKWHEIKKEVLPGEKITDLARGHPQRLYSFPDNSTVREQLRQNQINKESPSRLEMQVNNQQKDIREMQSQINRLQRQQAKSTKKWAEQENEFDQLDLGNLELGHAWPRGKMHRVTLDVFRKERKYKDGRDRVAHGNNIQRHLRLFKSNQYMSIAIQNLYGDVDFETTRICLDRYDRTDNEDRAWGLMHVNGNDMKLIEDMLSTTFFVRQLQTLPPFPLLEHILTTHSVQLRTERLPFKLHYLPWPTHGDRIEFLRTGNDQPNQNEGSPEMMQRVATSTARDFLVDMARLQRFFADNIPEEDNKEARANLWKMANETQHTPPGRSPNALSSCERQVIVRWVQAVVKGLVPELAQYGVTDPQIKFWTTLCDQEKSVMDQTI